MTLRKFIKSNKDRFFLLFNIKMPKKRQTKKMKKIRRIIKSRKKNIKSKIKISKKKRNSIGGAKGFQFADSGLFVSMGSMAKLKKTKKELPKNEIKNPVSKALLQVKGSKLTDSEFGGLLEVGMGDENSKGEILVGYCEQPDYNKPKPQPIKEKPKDEHGFFFILEPMKDSRSGDLGGYPYNFYKEGKKKELRGQNVKDLSPFLYVKPDVRPNCIPTPKKKKPVSLANVIKKAQNTLDNATSTIKDATERKEPEERNLNRVQKQSEKAARQKSNAEENLVEAIDKGNKEDIKDKQDKLAKAEKEEKEKKRLEEEAEKKLKKEQELKRKSKEKLELQKSSPAEKLKKACKKHNLDRFVNSNVDLKCDKKCKVKGRNWSKCVGDVIFKPDGSFTIKNDRCAETMAELILYTKKVSEKKNIGEFETCIKNKDYNDECKDGLKCTKVPKECEVSEERQICMKKI